MSGNIMRRTGSLLHDGFDIKGEIISLKLLDIPEDAFIKVQYLNKEGCWLTRCLCYRDDALISLFYAEDHYICDKNILVRKINTAIKLAFYVNTGRHSIFHKKYALNRQHLPLIRVAEGNKNAYLILSGEMKYDSYSGHLTLPAGEHEILICQGTDPALLLRNINKLLSEDTPEKPTEKGELANALDTVYTSVKYEKDLLFLYSLVLLGIKSRLPRLDFDEDGIIHGALPYKDTDDGSSIDTLYYICGKGAQAERCKGLFSDNFVRGNKIALNSRKRRAHIRQPRFKYGLCPYCRQNTAWLEKTCHSTYACVDCCEKASLPSNIPDDTEWLSDLPLLVMIYLGIDIPVFDNIPDLLKNLSEKELDSEMTALLLYALCIYELDERHEVYKKLISQRNDIGIWQEESCSPTVNALCCAAIHKYKNVL